MIQTLQQLYPSLTSGGLIIFCIFLLLYLIRFIYLFLFTGRILFRKKSTEAEIINSPISLILTVRNEEELLLDNLPTLLAIEGADYEVIAVDDFSQDNTYLVLGSFKKQFQKLKISSLNEETRYSFKLSQNIALKGASYDWVLPIAVAILKPDSNWLSAFANVTNEKNNVVIGYKTIEKEHSFSNHLYRVINFWLFMKSTSYILNGLPVVYSDENVAFKKQKYFEAGGFGTKIKEPFANLELVINNFIRKKSTEILFTSASIMRKKQQTNWDDFLDLLKKSYRIEKHLSIKKQLFLKLDEFSKFMFLLSIIPTIILLPEYYIIFVSLLGIQAIAYLLIIKISLNRLKEPKIFISSLVYGILIPLINLPYRWYFNYRSRKNKWRNTN
ncbi:MAG: glycosyltransferase [Prolixibacteraceae bacterium]|nr:glycosyltransferase [Prolixibacteraceae bacterium]